MTTTALYLSIQVHRSNRLDQRDVIREQVQVINQLASPIGAYDRRLAPKSLPKPDEETSPESSRPELKDLLKHRWNKEVATLAQKAHQSRWEDARATAVEGWKSVVRLVKRE